MGEAEGIKGAWAYVEGGMGAVSQSIANSAMSYGASVFTSKVKHPFRNNVEVAYLIFDIVISYYLIFFDAAYFDVRLHV